MTADEIELTGVVELRTVHSGSHDERRAPVLVVDDAAHRLHLVGENAFEEPTLSALAGRRVTVTGAWRAGVLRVREVRT
jgi:hypothetical protein